MYTCEIRINAKLVKEVSFRINAKLVKEELRVQNTFNKPITVVCEALRRIPMDTVIIIKDNDIKNMGEKA